MRHLRQGLEVRQRDGLRVREGLLEDEAPKPAPQTKARAKVRTTKMKLGTVPLMMKHPPTKNQRKMTWVQRLK